MRYVIKHACEPSELVAERENLFEPRDLYHVMNKTLLSLKREGKPQQRTFRVGGKESDQRETLYEGICVTLSLQHEKQSES